MDKKIRIGVIGPSEIAFRRTIPAILKCEDLEYAGLAHASMEEWPGQSTSHKDKCLKFKEAYGGEIYDGYRALINDPEVQAIYLPLPPSAHYKWGMEILNAGKHLISEKPFTTEYAESSKLVAEAEDNNIALHENYAYAFHKQIEEISSLLIDGKIGNLRLIRATFSFPYRGEEDFRYYKERGGGALIDCGGYPLNLATRFMGRDAKVIAACCSSSKNHNVDTYGSAMLKDENDVVAQISWGADNVYRCCIELHGSTGMLSSDRVFSPPAEMTTEIKIKNNSGEEVIQVNPDDQFQHSLEYFVECVNKEATRRESYERILKQAELIEQIKEKSR